MSDTQRLSVWGWFVRAFAGGVGAMFGVMTALVFACVACYVLVAVTATALSSFGNASFEQPVVFGGMAGYPTTECTPLIQAYPVNQGSFDPYAVAPQPYAVASQPAAVGSQPASYAAEPAAAPVYGADTAPFLNPAETEAE